MAAISTAQEFPVVNGSEMQYASAGTFLTPRGTPCGPLTLTAHHADQTRLLESSDITA
jgi:hypothetical protein